MVKNVEDPILTEARHLHEKDANIAIHNPERKVLSREEYYAKLKAFLKSIEDKKAEVEEVSVEPEDTEKKAQLAELQKQIDALKKVLHEE